jgi:acetolactate synthase-1/2/3 large subunit
MKQRVADYIADFLVSQGITDLFTVTGGGAMHLNDAFGHHPQLHCTYNHHEQACAIAAEAYARYSGNIAAVCVTSGPGGTNALTGVLGGWLDSVPMFILSGQIKFSTSIKSTKIPLRQLGDQEFNITDCAKTITKFSQMVIDPNDIAYFLEKALYIARHGRPGPVWLDIPLNVQGAVIETEILSHYDPAENSEEIPPKISDKIISEILKRIKDAKRPVIFAGSAIRSSGAHDDFLCLIEKLQIPVVTAWNAHDVVWDDHPFYCGRPGTIGTRGGNFVTQKSDLLFILGCRLNIRQISYNWEYFAPDAYKIMVDIDPGELLKPTLSIDLPIYADVKDIIQKLNIFCKHQTNDNHKKWLEWSKKINLQYPICLEEYYGKSTPINPYVFMKELFLCLEEGDVVVAANGSACVCSFQTAVLKKNQRLFTNSGCASMGYGLPASLGVAVQRKGRRVICLEGDGSIQMNLQELQTIVHNKLKVKIIWLNNNGYHSIRQTQQNLFNHPLCGVSSENGISFPDAQKIAHAYNIPSVKIESISSLKEQIRQVLIADGPAIIEVVLDQEQYFEPKLSSKRLPDGTMVSPPLEDMYPFLPEEEIKKIMQEAESL